MAPTPHARVPSTPVVRYHLNDHLFDHSKAEDPLRLHRDCARCIKASTALLLNTNRAHADPAVGFKAIKGGTMRATKKDVLCSILSRLTLREAIRTSVLSHRWRYMWTRLFIFKFGATTMLDSHSRGHLYKKSSPLTGKEKYEFLTGKTDWFINSIDAVLQQHQGDRVEELTVEFFLHRIHSDHLDAWARFAVASKTKKFGLYLGQPFLNYFEIQSFLNLGIVLYDFPCQLLGSSSIEELSLAHCSLKPPHDLDTLNHLTCLYLCNINIIEEDMNHLLSNCSTLEKLTLRNSKLWLTLRIPCSLKQLRCLVLQFCDKLRKVEINAPNLTRITYWGTPANIVFSQSSQLEYADIHFSADYWRARNLDFYLSKLHRNLPHIQSMTFVIFGSSKVKDLREHSYTFFQLTHLDWTWSTKVKMSLLHLATLLEAAPSLEELKLHLRPSIRVGEQPPHVLTKLKETIPKIPHTHLKKVEISDFYCDKWQIEIALYLLCSAIELESMTIKKSREPSVKIYERDIHNLRQEVPANVKLQIL